MRPRRPTVSALAILGSLLLAPAASGDDPPGVPPPPPGIPEPPPVIPEAPPAIPEAPPAIPAPPPSDPAASSVPVPPVSTNIPAPSPSVGTSLDELFARVEGETITRRMIVRQLGRRTEEENEEEYERRIHARLVALVRTRILVKAGQRFGLDVKPDVLDKTVEEVSGREVRDAKARAERNRLGSGANITFAKLLADRGQSLEEYKAELANEMLVQNYFHILMRGVPGKRAQFDSEPSPGDAFRLYERHPDAFDVKPGVRMGLFQIAPADLLDDGKRTFDEATSEARRRMAALLAEFLDGRRAPGELALQYGIPRRQFRVTEPNAWDERRSTTASPMEDWMFAPERRARDTNVFEVRGSFVGVAITEVRGSRRRTFDEVASDVLAMIRGVRENRFRARHTLELLRSASVEPRSLIDELDASLREALQRLDDDPVAKDIRMR